MASKEKMEFVFIMAKHSEATLHDLQRLLRFAATHQRICTDECNRELSEREQAKKIRVQRKILALCTSAKVEARFSGDPRGCTVKLRLPDGTYNNWDGETVGVPA